jgi:two-component system response regulator TctD
LKYLLIEDNERLAKAIQDRLLLDGHAVDRAGDIASAKHFVEITDYDLILLDIMLPDGDGRDFLAFQRTAGYATPVVALTARSEVSDRVSMLDLGADDYIVKPFDFAELEARCRAVLRRRSVYVPTTQSIGDITFDSLACTLTVQGETIKLRNRELRLLEVFINAPDQVFSKSKLVDRLFSYDQHISDNAIEVYVGRLRRHLQGSNVRIFTERGLGYRLRAT